MNKEQQVEELENEYYFWTHNLLTGGKHNLYKKETEKVKQKAKELKEEIEEGCGKIKETTYNDAWEEENYSICDKENLCSDCQNLIQRLNIIIGEKE